MPRITVELCECGKPKGHDVGTSDFFVSIIRNAGLPSQQVGLVLGPYATHEEALANVHKGRTLAHAADLFTAFDAFGTLGLKGELKGKHKGVLGT